MGAFAPPAAWNKPKAKPPAVDPAVREAPLKALLALGLEKLATTGCDDRCYAATTPGRPLNCGDLDRPVSAGSASATRGRASADVRSFRRESFLPRRAPGRVVLSRKGVFLRLDLGVKDRRPRLLTGPGPGRKPKNSRSLQLGSNEPVSTANRRRTSRRSQQLSVRERRSKVDPEAAEIRNF